MIVRQIRYGRYEVIFEREEQRLVEEQARRLDIAHPSVVHKMLRPALSKLKKAAESEDK